jgi:hypothetical protein
LAWISMIPSNLCPFTWMLLNPAFITCYDLRKKVSVLGIIMYVLAHRKLILFLAVILQTQHKFCCSLPHGLIFG